MVRDEPDTISIMICIRRGAPMCRRSLLKNSQSSRILQPHHYYGLRISFGVDCMLYIPLKMKLIGYFEPLCMELLTGNCKLKTILAQRRQQPSFSRHLCHFGGNSRTSRRHKMSFRRFLPVFRRAIQRESCNFCNSATFTILGSPSPYA